MNHTDDADVLIVGGGPAGMVTALELGWRGVDFILVDAGGPCSAPPTVSTLGPRSMEIFRRHGLADAIRTVGLARDHPLDIAWVSLVGGHELLRLRRGTPAARPPFAHTPEPDAVCPQDRLMPLLARAVGVHPHGPLRVHCRMEGFRLDGDGVTAAVRDLGSGQVSTVRARFLVACDGTSSAVRAVCRVAAPARCGTRRLRHIFFRAPELKALLGERMALCYVLMGSLASRFHVRAMDGRGLYRLTTDTDDGPRESADARALVRGVLAVDTPFEVVADRRWTLRPFVADRFRAAERVFLVGDAAHTLPPAGGFGVNTGICGAADVAWKLAAELKGWAGPQLLDSYGIERSAVALEALQEADAHLLRTLVRAPDPAGAPAAWAATAELLAREGAVREFDAPEVHLGFRYTSPLIVPDRPERPGTVGPRRPGPRAAPGCRAPHAWLSPGTSTLDLFGRTFSLLCFARPEGRDEFERAFAAHHVPLRITVCADPEIARLYERAFVLVRPDGHVAWRGDTWPADASTLAAKVRGAC
ncbi:FAD-dependent monooxygenase [Streptomyces sp. MUM 136J]|uniref:FAD-dependent monooxygenase n=1 Tax=Streptomyces sp. MUM 136J TaxID=2791992 RepID=UPI001F03DA01|nr:FAD-dependent monooxygenase [Streptomyces sp. MUM 136J]MCH0569824.1 FAD-dependent monooxygenase [Streptomyces sp. MUM 136J]